MAVTNRDPDVRYDRPEQAIPAAIEQLIHRLVRTNLPGIVQSYDPSTKRAIIQPAIRTRLAPVEGDPEERLLDKPPILNVPVKQTATGGHMVHHQVDPGDVVLIHFSQRGLDQFKAAWGQLADPTKGSFFEARDAMAIPWGREDMEPVRSTGWGVQNADGSAYISVDGDTIRIVTGTSSIVMTPTQMTLIADRIYENP